MGAGAKRAVVRQHGLSAGDSLLSEESLAYIWMLAVICSLP